MSYRGVGVGVCCASGMYGGVSGVCGVYVRCVCVVCVCVICVCNVCLVRGDVCGIVCGVVYVCAVWCICVWLCGVCVLCMVCVCVCHVPCGGWHPPQQQCPAAWLRALSCWAHSGQHLGVLVWQRLCPRGPGGSAGLGSCPHCSPAHRHFLGTSSPCCACHGWSQVHLGYVRDHLASSVSGLTS